MALTGKKYSKIYSETGSDGDLITADEKALMKKEFDDNTYIDDKDALNRLGPVLYKLQLITEELDYLRTEISANKDKVSMAIGSKATQAMAGNTALLALGTSSTTALAGDTNIVTIGSSTTIAFGDMITVPAKGKTPASYSIVMTVTNGGVSKSITLTLA